MFPKLSRSMNNRYLLLCGLFLLILFLHLYRKKPACYRQVFFRTKEFYIFVSLMLSLIGYSHVFYIHHISLWDLHQHNFTSNYSYCFNTTIICWCAGISAYYFTAYLVRPLFCCSYTIKHIITFILHS